jgi:hypothetical protein
MVKLLLYIDILMHRFRGIARRINSLKRYCAFLPFQDELNELNKPFFDRCDGIFLNYTWKTPGTCFPRDFPFGSFFVLLETRPVMSMASTVNPDS